MHVITTSKDGATIDFSLLELVGLSNALNEVLNGIEVPEFATRIALERSVAEQLQAALSRVIDRLGVGS